MDKLQLKLVAEVDTFGIGHGISAFPDYQKWKNYQITSL